MNLFPENVASADVLVLRTPKAFANECIEELRRLGALDTARRPKTDNGFLFIPIRVLPSPFDPRAFSATVATVPLDPAPQPARPFDVLQAAARAIGLDSRLLPRRWERLGDVLVVRPPSEIRWRDEDAPRVGKVYGETLRAKTVVEDLAPVRGPWREPTVRWLWGDGTETVHRENGVRFALDVAKVMFSSGNLPERIRMARVPREGETVVDLFAGIGYFAVPMAVHSRVARIVACEANPTAYRYLCKNARLNRVGIIEPRLGDCRDMAPNAIGDRVVMGHFDAPAYLDVAFRAVKERATFHVHGLLRSRDDPAHERNLAEAARTHGFSVANISRRIVKSYGPKTWHVVLDADVVRV